jgi:hypothetical protein
VPRSPLNPLCLFLTALACSTTPPNPIPPPSSSRPPSTAFALPALSPPAPPLLPSPSPEPEPEPAPVPPPDPGRADLDPTNDATVAPPALIADCEARLEAAGIRYRTASLPTRKAKEGHECGAPQVVVYRGPENGVRWSSAPIVTCGMALALARFEHVLQEESSNHFGQRVVRIEHLGTYACREMARYDWVSEHSYANAIDVSVFVLENGRKISVERHFGRPTSDPKTIESRFLRGLASRLYDEEVFSVVVTEFFDKLHRNHFHFDMARYRVDGTR